MASRCGFSRNRSRRRVRPLRIGIGTDAAHQVSQEQDRGRLRCPRVPQKPLGGTVEGHQLTQMTEESLRSAPPRSLDIAFNQKNGRPTARLYPPWASFDAGTEHSAVCRPTACSTLNFPLRQENRDACRDQSRHGYGSPQDHGYMKARDFRGVVLTHGQQ